MPIMAAISGEKFGTVEDVREELQQRDPDAEPGQRGDHRQAHRHDGPEGQQHDDDGGGDADALARPGRRRGGGLDRAAAELDLEAVVGGGLRRRDDLLDGGGRDVGGVGRELDLRRRRCCPCSGRRSGGLRPPRTGW